MKTYLAKPNEVERRWWLVDADGQVLGRLASRLAIILQGKHKATYTPHVLTGDAIVVVNAEKIAVTGNKLESKKYYRHSGYRGGLSEKNLARVLETEPARAIQDAVRRMLPKSRLGRQMFGNLYVYAGPAHPHQAQKPAPYSLERTGQAASAKEAAES